MKEEKTAFCRLCEPMCGLRVDVENGRVLHIRGDRDHPLSKGWVCRRGVAFADVHNDPDRLRHPLRKGQRTHERVGWDVALSEVSGKLRHILDTYGSDAVAVYMGNPMAFCTYGSVSVPAFVRALGTSQFYTSGSQDCNNKFAASERVLGSAVRQPVPDLDRVEFLLIIGANPAVSGMSFVQVPRPIEALRGIRKRGGEVVVVDPRKTETAKLASRHLFIQPDTDCFFLLSLLWVLVDRGRVDRHWIEADPKGYETLKEVVNKWPPEKTEPITGISSDMVVEIALRLSGSGPAACYGSVGINLGRNGTLTYWLLLVLNLLAGHFDRPGGSLLCTGVMDVDRLYRMSGVGRSRKRSARGDFLPVMGTYPAALLADEILSATPGRVRALVVVAGNPLLSVPNEDHLKEALQNLDLLVCLDLYQNETGTFAHYLFPTTDFLEREDLNLSHAALQIRRYAVWTPPVVRPAGEQREEWQILEDLSNRIHRPLWGRNVGTVVKVADRLSGPVRRFVPKRRAGSSGTSDTPAPIVIPRLMMQLLLRFLGEKDLPSLEKARYGILLKPHTLGELRRKKRWPGKSLKIKLAPPDLVREALKLEGYLSLGNEEEGAFLLIGKRERHTHNTWMHNVDGLVGEESTNYLYMHPEDAREKGIREGDWTWVKNAEGVRIRVPCRLTADLKPGVVALPHGWGHRYACGWRKARKRPGVNVNRLASDSVWKLEPVAGVAWMNGIPVDVEKAEEPGRKRRTAEVREESLGQDTAEKPLNDVKEERA